MCYALGFGIRRNLCQSHFQWWVLHSCDCCKSFHWWRDDNYLRSSIMQPSCLNYRSKLYRNDPYDKSTIFCLIFVLDPFNPLNLVTIRTEAVFLSGILLLMSLLTTCDVSSFLFSNANFLSQCIHSAQINYLTGLKYASHWQEILLRRGKNLHLNGCK